MGAGIFTCERQVIARVSIGFAVDFACQISILFFKWLILTLVAYCVEISVRIRSGPRAVQVGCIHLQRSGLFYFFYLFNEQNEFQSSM
jgi:hypothetical protein